MSRPIRLQHSHRSAVWKYFNITNRENRKAECLFCRKILSYKTTSGNLKWHLKMQHSRVHDELVNRSALKTSNSRDFDEGKPDIREFTVSVNEDGSTFEYVDEFENVKETSRNEGTDDDDQENPLRTKNEETDVFILDNTTEATEEKRPTRLRNLQKTRDWHNNIDNFARYIGSMLKMLPRQTAVRIQGLIVQTLVKEQMKYL